MAELARATDVPIVFDIGSGLLVPHPLLPDEPDADSALRSGAALVTASGDKLLGGPQARLLLGRADLVRRLTRHPLARALRVDKLTLAALEATLTGPPPPVAAALAADPDAIAERVRLAVRRLHQAGVDARPAATQAAVGGGGAPGVPLPSAAVSLPPSLAAPLRRGPAQPPGDPADQADSADSADQVGVAAVVGRVEDGRALLDLRAVPPEDDERLIAAVLAATLPATPGAARS